MALLNPKKSSTAQTRLTAVPQVKKKKMTTVGKKAPADTAATEYAAALHLLDLEHRKLRTGFADHLGLAHNEYDAFMFITETRTTTPKDLATTLRFTTGATTALIDRLENMHLVHRIPNPDDRRSVLLELTPHGKTQAKWVINNYTHLAHKATTTHPTLSPAELTNSITHITQLIAAITEAEIDKP